jgi:methionyl-tRNA synthetase
LYILADTIRQVAILTQPIMPDASSKILDQLSIDNNFRNFDCLSNSLESNISIEKPIGVFPRWS